MTDLEKNKSLDYKIHTKGNGVYLFVIEGLISAADEMLLKRDGGGLWEFEEITLKSENDSQVLIIEVPM